MKEERKANQVGNKEVTKGFGKGRVKPPIQMNREEHPEQARETQPQKDEQPRIFS